VYEKNINNPGMRRKIFRYLLIFLAILIALVVWQPWILRIVVGAGKLLSKTTEYRATNENGQEIKAEFYLKDVHWKGKATRRIIVRFKEIPISEQSHRNDSYLILIPDSSWIGSPVSQTEDDYKVIFGKWLFQSEAGAHFKIINTIVGADVYQLIERSNFTNNTIKFNTFQELEYFGKEIIISFKSRF
jgi:hypothetical protein